MTISQDKDFYWDDDHFFEGASYWEARPTMLQVPVSSWKEIKSFILKICKKQGDCQQINKMMLKIDK